MLHRFFVRSREEVEGAYLSALKRGYVIPTTIAHLGILVYNSCFPLGLSDSLLILIPSVYGYYFYTGYIIISLLRLNSQDRNLILLGRLKFSDAIWLGLLFGFLVQVISFFIHSAFYYCLLHLLKADFNVPHVGIYFNESLYASLWVVFLAPLEEEAFIHFFLQTLLQRFGPLISIGLTSTFFALIHLDDWVNPPSIVRLFSVCFLVFPALLFLSFVRWKTGSLLMTFVIHATFNFTSYFVSPIGQFTAK